MSIPQFAFFLYARVGRRRRREGFV